MLRPNESAAAPDRAIATLDVLPSVPREAAARTIPTTTTPSAVPTPADRCSPSTTATTAATAPSVEAIGATEGADRKSTRLNSSHVSTSYAVFCLKKKTSEQIGHSH